VSYAGASASVSCGLRGRVCPERQHWGVLVCVWWAAIACAWLRIILVFAFTLVMVAHCFIYQTQAQ
jgi:hypothetical protein